MSGGVSVDQFVRTDIVSNDSACTDETALAESDAANNRCVRANCDSFFDPCFHWHPVSIATARREIVCEHGIWTKKHIIGDVHVLPDADSVFDRHVITDGDAAFDESMIADVAVFADTNVLQHVSERPDARAFANRICLN